MKNRTKQMLSMLLAVCMAAMLLPTGAFAQETTPAQTPVGSGVVEVVGEPATEPTGEVTETPATTPTEDDAAPVPDVVPQTSGDAAPTLNEAQQAFVDAVAALNKDALVALAEAYVADPTEETDAAFYAEYDKADGFDGNSAAELYGALTKEQQSDETVAASKDTLDEIISAVNAALAIETPAGDRDTYDDSTPLTFTAQEARSTVTFSYDSGTDVQYKQGDGEWQNYTKGTTITLTNVGDTVSFKGTNVVTNDQNHFSMSGKIAASGDVTSLTNGVGGDAALGSS